MFKNNKANNNAVILFNINNLKFKGVWIKEKVHKFFFFELAWKHYDLVYCTPLTNFVPRTLLQLPEQILKG